MNTIIRLLLVGVFFLSITFAKSGISRDVTSFVKKSNFDSSMRIDKNDNLDNQNLDKKRSHKRRRKVRKPRKGIR